MHELGIIQQIIQQVEQVAHEHALKRVQRVTIQLGEWRQCVPDILQFAFEQLAAGTISEGAELIIERVPVRMQCVACHHIFQIDPRRIRFACPECGHEKLEGMSGKECVLASVEGEN